MADKKEKTCCACVIHSRGEICHYWTIIHTFKAYNVVMEIHLEFTEEYIWRSSDCTALKMSISRLIYHVSHMIGGIFAASCYFLYENRDEFLGDNIVVKNIYTVLHCLKMFCLPLWFSRWICWIINKWKCTVSLYMLYLDSQLNHIITTGSKYLWDILQRENLPTMCTSN